MITESANNALGIVHFLYVPTAPKLEFPDSPTTTQWTDHAVGFYQFFYTYYEKTEEEYKWIEQAAAWLETNLPAEYRGRVVLLAPQAAFMGEDIYVVDGNITHSIH